MVNTRQHESRSLARLVFKFGGLVLSAAALVVRIFASLHLDAPCDATFGPICMIRKGFESEEAEIDHVRNHLTNLCLHCFNIALLFSIARRLARSAWVAGIACMLFAFTPIQIDTVAWVSQRRILLTPNNNYWPCHCCDPVTTCGPKTLTHFGSSAIPSKFVAKQCFWHETPSDLFSPRVKWIIRLVPQFGHLSIKTSAELAREISLGSSLIRCLVCSFIVRLCFGASRSVLRRP